MTLQLRHVTKSFGGQIALRDVDLSVAHGEVHALVGQNGSGKSTLIKVMSGYHQPEPGAEAELDGLSSSSAAPTRRERPACGSSTRISRWCCS